MSLEGQSSHDRCAAIEAEFQGLLQRARDGDKDAGIAFVRRFGPNILKIIRRKYLPKDSTLRPLIDSADLSQMAWMKMWEEVLEGKPIRDEEEFMKQFCTVARQVFLMQHREQVQAAKRSRDREETSEAAENAPDASLDPTVQTALREECRILLESTRGRDRQILIMIRDGYRTDEIAMELQVNVRTVQRALEAIRERMKRKRGGEGD